MTMELTVDKAQEIAEGMRSGIASRSFALEQCRRYGFQVRERSDGAASSEKKSYVPQQDSFPAQCAWRAAMYLHANTVGVGQMFFRFDVDDMLRAELGKESAELKAVRGLSLPVYRELWDTNFYTAVYSALHDMSVLGVGVAYVEFDKTRKRLAFSTYRVDSESCWLYGDGFGEADQFGRKFRLSAKQAFAKWGDKVHARVKEQVSGGTTSAEETEYLWLVFPRRAYGLASEVPSAGRPAVASNRKAWASVVVDTTNKHIVEESGYDRFPFAVCPWGQDGNGVYGWGPTEMSLPDIKYLAKLKFQLGRAIEKTVNPAMIIPFSWDGFETSPGSYNYVEANGSVRDAFGVVEPPAQLPDIREQQQRTMLNIRSNFLLDAFETFDEMTKTMSATEARGRVGQSVRAIAPVALNVHNRLLSPLLQRSMDLLAAHGVLSAELPAAVSRNRIRVKYVSVLSSMVLEAETNKVSDFFARVLEMQQTRAAFGPMFDAYFDLDAVFSHFADFFAIPEDIVRSASARAEEMARLTEEAQAQAEQERETAVLSKINPQERSSEGSYAARKGY